MSQETKSITAAKQLLMNAFNWSKSKVDNFIRINLRNDIPILRDTNHGAKFILGVTRMYIDWELNNAQAISQLNTVLKYIASDAHINEYDRNLNGESLQTLVNRFSQNVTDDLEKDKETIGSQTYTSNTQYRIVPINSFEEAKQYGKYTSWCITHDKNMFDSYTNNGIAQFYFILRNGFENEHKEQGENCPLDSYGLSMVAVCVDNNGGLKTCTCRWNHDNEGNDSIMNTKEISELIGRNFYEVFKPNNKWEETLQNATTRLKNGEEPKKIFDFVSKFYDDIRIVKLNNKYNVIDKQGNILSSQWFDYISIYVNGEIVVKLNYKWNIINKNGCYICRQWFDWIYDFYSECRVVQLNGLYNYITKNGKLLSEQWFYFASNFYESFGKIKLGNKWNFIDKQGKILSNQWFDWVDFFHCGSARVGLNNQEHYINEKGEILEVFEEVD